MTSGIMGLNFRRKRKGKRKDGPLVPCTAPRHFSRHFRSLLGIRFRIHFWSLLEAVSGLILELIWSVERIPERTKDADGILEDPYPNLESFRCTLLRYYRQDQYQWANLR